jgi:oxalate decarboxylase/phosphoglucose isomerase-like protein (cupin superfamily)
VVDSKTSGVVIKPSPAFVNEAGSIVNIAFGEFTCISLIHSVAGAYRSRHWHSTDSHVLYVLRGEMWYKERDLDGEYPAEWTKVLQGESVYTPPLVVHQTWFPVNTTLISASKNRRDHASHEADVQRVEEPWLAIET